MTPDQIATIITYILDGLAVVAVSVATHLNVKRSTITLHNMLPLVENTLADASSKLRDENNIQTLSAQLAESLQETKKLRREVKELKEAIMRVKTNDDEI